MIKSIRVVNHLDESLLMELGFPERSGFIVEHVDGLGASNANVNVTELSTSDGALYNSARVNTRNITMTLRFLGTPSIEDTRQKTYKYFPIKKNIQLIFETDNRISVIKGYVESNEARIFNQETGTLISVICPDPFFYSLQKNITVFSGVEAAFEFPFSNESLDESRLEMGRINNYTEQNVFYSGDMGIGVNILIHAVGPVSNISIYNTQTREAMKLNLELISGDDLMISTIKGAKQVILLRAGNFINAVNYLDKTSDWFELSKGDNVFTYLADSGVENLQFVVQNQVRYEGI